MYTNGTTHIDMYEHTFIPWVHFFAHFLSLLKRNAKKKDTLKEREEFRNRTDGPRGEG